MKKYLIILKKELICCFRDKRSLLLMLLPMLIIPLMLYASNQVMKNAEISIAENISISTSSKEELADFIEMLNLSGINVSVVDSDDPYDALKTSKSSLIIDKNENGYSIVYDMNSPKSATALSIITSCIEAQKNAYIINVFNQHGESIENLNEYTYVAQDVSTFDEADSNSYLAMLAPMMLIMFIATGASNMALDMFCGEKERGSLEGILATQVSRKSLYFAKVSAVFIFSCISAMISAAGYMISFGFDNSMMNGAGLKMSALQIFIFFAIMLSFALFSAAAISVLSVEAKTVKEGGLRTMLFSLIPSMLSALTMYIETGNINFAINFIPFINTIVTLKSIFLNVINPISVLVSVGTTLLYSIVLLIIGYKIMNSERILNK